MLSNINKMAYFYAVYAVCVTIFSTGGKFHSVSNFTQLHVITQVAHSYALLTVVNHQYGVHRPGFPFRILSHSLAEKDQSCKTKSGTVEATCMYMYTVSVPVG